MKLRNWFILFLPLIGSAATLLIAFEANSESSGSPAENPCKAQWFNLVSSIEGLISSGHQRERAVVFASQEGHIFNCLDQPLSNSVLQELQFWEISRSKSIASDPAYDDSYRPNFCNSSYGTVHGIQIMTIHLPYSAEEFSTPACTTRLRGVPGRVKQFLETE